MNNVGYRTETFTEFIKTNRPRWPLLILWIPVGILTVVKTILVLCSISSIDWSMIVFYNISLLLLTLKHYSENVQYL